MTNIYEQLGNTLESATQNFANQHSAALAQAIYPLVLSALVCWLLIMGYQAMSGRLQEPLVTLAERAASIVFLAAIAFGPSVYQVEILNSFDGLQTALVSAFAGVETTPYKAADTALQKGFDLAASFSRESSITSFSSFYGWYVGSLIIYASSVVITFIAAGMIMVAKASLALVLAFGQIAIACAIFPATRKIFDAFCNIVLNRILTIALISAAMGLALDIFTGVASGYDHVASEPISFAGELLIAVCVCGTMLFAAGTIASELAGGVGIAVSNPITKAAQIATAPARSVAKYLNTQTARTSAKTGQQEIASRASHLLKGNTAMNPAYRQQVQNSKSGWGPATGGNTQSTSSPKTPTDKIKDMARRRDAKQK